MRIALVIEQFEPGIGGAENAAWTVAHTLARAGDEMHVVTRKAAPTQEVVIHPIDVAAGWQPLRVSRFSRAAAREAPRGDFDIVYSLSRTAHQDVYRASGGSHASYMERCYRPLPRAVRRASPRHATLLALEGRVFRDTSQIVQTNSEMVRRELQHRFSIPSKRFAVIRNGVDSERFHPDVCQQFRAALRGEFGFGEEPVWLFAGSGFARKGLDTALRALAQSSRRDTRLLVAGADRSSSWQRLARSLGVAARTVFVGFRQDMPALYGAADALLLPTRYDASANVCFEAAAAGIPVLTSAANGAAEVLSGAGMTIRDPEDTAGFAKALDTLAESSVRSDLGEAARTAAESLSWSAHVSQLRELFARIRR